MTVLAATTSANRRQSEQIISTQEIPSLRKEERQHPDEPGSVRRHHSLSTTTTLSPLSILLSLSFSSTLVPVDKDVHATLSTSFSELSKASSARKFLEITRVGREQAVSLQKGQHHRCPVAQISLIASLSTSDIKTTPDAAFQVVRKLLLRFSRTQWPLQTVSPPRLTVAATEGAKGQWAGGVSECVCKMWVDLWSKGMRAGPCAIWIPSDTLRRDLPAMDRNLRHQHFVGNSIEH